MSDISSAAPEVNASSPPDDVKLCHYVEDAFSLQDKLECWTKDNKFIDGGGKLIYSADADVIKLYLAPAENAFPKQSESGKIRPGYTTVFRYDDQTTAAALADGVCEAIFFDRDARALGTIILPSIETELHNIFHGLFNDASKAPGIKKQLAELHNDIRKKFESKELAKEKKFAKIEQEYNELADRYFGDSGYITQLDRFNILTKQSRLKSIWKFINENRTQDWSRTVVAPYTWYEDVHHDRIKKNLIRRLARSKGENADADADALASLTIINWRLAKAKIRLLHVTGDPTLYALLSKMDFHQDIDEWDNCEDLAGLDFASAFLRHPASFLAAPDVPFPTLRSNELRIIEGITGLLGYLLSGIPEGAEQPGEDLLARCQRALVTYPDAIRDFETSWKQLVSPLVIKRLEAAALQRSTFKPGGAFEILSQRIDTEVEDRWMRCLETALSTGFNFIVDPKAGETSSSREVPIIWFDCKDADDALGRIQDSLLLRAHDEPQQTFDYETPLKKLADVRYSEYFHFLTFAVLYAGNGRWNTTAMLADQAIGIADSIREHQRRALRDEDDRTEKAPISESQAAMSGVSGREAYFVAAAARRVTAREEADFDAAAKLLMRAHEALIEDHQYVRDHDKADYLEYLSPTRFEIEALSIDLSRYLFRHFGSKSDAPPTLSPAEFTSRAKELLIMADREPDQRIASAARRRSLMHILVRFLHDPDWRKAVRLSQTQQEEMRETLSELEATVNEQAPASYVLRAVILAAKFELRVQQGKFNRKVMERDADALFQPDQIADNIVAVYDRKRFADLAAICEASAA